MKEGWKVKKLGEICEVLDSKRIPITKENRSKGDIPYYGATGIQDYVKGFIFDEDLVLLGEDGAKWGAGDNSAYKISGKAWVNNHAHVLRPFRDITTDNWLIYYLNYSDLTEYITGVTVPKLNQQKMRNIPIPVPPIVEQERIVGRLDELFAHADALHKNTQRAIDDAQELFQSKLQQAMTPKDGWKEAKIGDFFDITSSKRVFQADWKSEGVPFYRAREIVKIAKQGYVKNELFISEEMYTQYSAKYGIPQAGDILITGVGTLGICYIVKENDRFYFKDGNIIWLKKKRVINSRFVEYAYRTDYIVNQVNNYKGAVVGTYTIVRAKNTKLFVPPIDEQRRIVAELDALSGRTAQLQANFKRQLALVEELKQSVLHEAFEGNL